MRYSTVKAHFAKLDAIREQERQATINPAPKPAVTINRYGVCMCRDEAVAMAIAEAIHKNFRPTFKGNLPLLEVADQGDQGFKVDWYGIPGRNESFYRQVRLIADRVAGEHGIKATWM